MAAAQTGITSFLICSNDHYTKRDQVQIRAHPKFANGATVTFQDTDILQQLAFDAIYSMVERQTQEYTDYVCQCCAINWQNVIGFCRMSTNPENPELLYQNRLVGGQEDLAERNCCMLYMAHSSFLMVSIKDTLRWYSTVNYEEPHVLEVPIKGLIALVPSSDSGFIFAKSSSSRIICVIRSNKSDLGGFLPPRACKNTWQLELTPSLVSPEFFASTELRLAGLITDTRLKLYSYNVDESGFTRSTLKSSVKISKLCKSLPGCLLKPLNESPVGFSKWMIFRKYSLIALSQRSGNLQDQIPQRLYVLALLDSKLRVLDAFSMASFDFSHKIVHARIERTEFFITRLLASELRVFMVHKSRLCPVTVLGQTILIPTENSDGIMALQACTSSDDELIVAGVELAKRIKMRFQGV